MDYIVQIQKTIDYIDEHITEKFTVEQLAQLAGFSTYHYYRVFFSFTGMTVMEYVTRRKLYHALYELGRGDKIIDIAMQYGFDTHAGFTKAFKKHFGYPPKVYRIHAIGGVPQKVYLTKLRKNKIGGVVMQPIIIEREAFRVVGYEFKSTLKNKSYTRDVPAFWEERGLGSGETETKLYTKLNPKKHGEYCICLHPDMETDEFSYILAVGVEDFDKAENDMYQFTVPQATYAVFTTPPVNEHEFVDSIQGTWKYILEEWFPVSGYEIDETKVDFEYYDERCHTWENSKIMMDIYIPIKRANLQ